VFCGRGLFRVSEGLKLATSESQGLLMGSKAARLGLGKRGNSEPTEEGLTANGRSQESDTAQAATTWLHGDVQHSLTAVKP